jgi:hypothetical protein
MDTLVLKGPVFLVDHKCSQCQQKSFSLLLAAGLKTTQDPANLLNLERGDLRLIQKAKDHARKGQTGLAMDATRRLVRLRRCPQALARLGQMPFPS